MLRVSFGVCRRRVGALFVDQCWISDSTSQKMRNMKLAADLFRRSDLFDGFNAVCKETFKNDNEQDKAFRKEMRKVYNSLLEDEYLKDPDRTVQLLSFMREDNIPIYKISQNVFRDLMKVYKDSQNFEQALKVYYVSLGYNDKYREATYSDLFTLLLPHPLYLHNVRQIREYQKGPNKNTFSDIDKILVQIAFDTKQFEILEDIIQDIHSNNISQPAFNRLLHGYKQLKDMDNLTRVLDKWFEVKFKLDTGNMSAVWHGFIITNQVERAVDIIQMCSVRIFPELPTISMINGTLREFQKHKKIDRAVDYLDWLTEHAIFDKVKSDESFYDGALFCYISEGRYKKVVELFESAAKHLDKLPGRMCKRGILGYIHEKKNTEALEIVKKYMKPNNMFPDVSTCSSILKSFAGEHEIFLAEEFFDEMIKHESLNVDVTHYNAMISVYAKAGQIKKAMEFYEKMNKNNISADSVTYNTILRACSTDKKFNIAVDVYNIMKEKNVTVDKYTFHHLIHSCEKPSELDTALVFFNRMIMEGVTPQTSLLNYLISYTGQCRRMDKLDFIIHTMEKLNISKDERTNQLIEQYKGKSTMKE